LRAVRIQHSDVVHSQALFVDKFDKACYQHELVINDVADCVVKWPVDPKDIECAGLTEKEIRKEWMDIFPKQESRVFSVQL
jgi:hypothetical protein